MPKYHTPTARASVVADLTIRNSFNQVSAQVLIQLLQLLTFLASSGRWATLFASAKMRIAANSQRSENNCSRQNPAFLSQPRWVFAQTRHSFFLPSAKRFCYTPVVIIRFHLGAQNAINFRSQVLMIKKRLQHSSGVLLSHFGLLQAR
jgi:hypothetical protein